MHDVAGKSTAGRHDSPVPRLPGDEGVWFFVVADLLGFSVFFLLFIAGRMQAPELYEASRRQLDAGLGLFNTLILLTSSLVMVRAVDAVRAGERALARRYLLGTVAVASLFVVSKVFEYGAKFSHGIGLLTNEFFTYYFILTGVHLLHFTIGIAAILVCWARVGRQPLDAKMVVWTEATGSYWHLVDLLWIVLFPMLYLLRAA